MEKQFGTVVEDPPVKLEMPRMSNPKAMSDSSDHESTGTLDFDDQKNSSRHLASPLKKRSVTAILSSDNSKLLAPRNSVDRAPLKNSLLSRFLRSLTERKFENKKLAKKPSKLRTLYIKNAKFETSDFKELNDGLAREIREHINLKKEMSSKNYAISSEMRELFKRTIFRDKSEELYKVYKVRSSYMANEENEGLLSLLTNKTLYIAGSRNYNSYCNQFVIPYNELDMVMVSEKLKISFLI